MGHLVALGRRFLHQRQAKLQRARNARDGPMSSGKYVRDSNKIVHIHPVIIAHNFRDCSFKDRTDSLRRGLCIS
jgi:hypothetical protein